MTATRLHRFDFYVADPATGLPVSGASVSPRRQGATTRTTGPNTFTVENIGAIRHASETGAPATDSVQLFKADGTVRDLSVRTLTAIGAATLTVGGPGFPSTVANDRFSPSTNLPTMYADSEGTEVVASLATDANGHAGCWMALSVADVYVERVPGGSTSDVWLLMDWPGGGGDIVIANTFGNGASTYRSIDTLRAMSAGDRHLAGLVQGVEKWWFDRDGKLTLAGGMDIAGVLAAAAAATFASTASIADVLTLTKNAAGALLLNAASGGIALSGASGLIDVSGASGIIQQTGVTGKIIANRLWANKGTPHVAGDWSNPQASGWGATAVLTVPANSKDSGGQISILAQGGGITANPTITLTFKDGTWGAGMEIVCCRAESSAHAAGVGVWGFTGRSATTATFTFIGTPTAGNTYAMSFIVVRTF